MKKFAQRMTLIWAAAMLLIGCPTQGTMPLSGFSIDRDDRTYSIPGSLINLSETYQQGDFHNSLLVTVRYPARLTNSATLAWVEARHGIYRKYGAAPASDADHQRALANQIVKTTYHALELYTYLSSILPDGTVGLQPTEVDTDSNGMLVQKAPVAPVPTVLVLEFLAFVHSDALGERGIRTFGTGFAPVTMIATSPQAWVATAGVIAQRHPDVPSIGIDPLQGAYGHGGIRYIDHDVNQYLGAPERRCTPTGDIRITSLPLRPTKYLSLPLLELEMDATAIRAQADGRTETSPAIRYHQMIGSIVVQALNRIDHYLAVRDAWKNRIAFYDPELAERWPRWPLSPADRERMALLKQAIGYERRFLSTVSKEFYHSDEVRNFSDSVRRITVSELTLQEQAEEIKAQRDAQIAFTMFASLASGIMNRNANFLKIAQDIVASAAMIDSQSKQSIDALKRSFDRHIGAQSAKQQEFVFSTGKGQTIIRAKTLAGYRRDARQLYQDVVRNLKRTDRDSAGTCSIKANDNADRTVWSGNCPAGRANGYGLAQHYKSGRYLGENEGYVTAGIFDGPYWYYEASGFDSLATSDTVYPIVGLPPHYKSCRTFLYLFGGFGSAVGGKDNGAFEFAQHGELHRVGMVNDQQTGAPTPAQLRELEQHKAEIRKVWRALIGRQEDDR